MQATLSALPPNHWFRCAAQSPVVHEMRTVGASTSPWGSPSGVPGPLRLALDHGARPHSIDVKDTETTGLISNVARPKPADPCRCLDVDCHSGSRRVACVCVGMFSLFVAACSVLLIVVVVRVDDILEQIDTEPLTRHMHEVLDEAHEAATNSRGFGTDLRTTLAQVTPALLGAVNATTDMVKRMDDFSQHPAWTISAGLPGLGGPGAMPMG